MLIDKCRIISNSGDDTFVGLKIENGEIQINFPHYYHFQSILDKDVQNDILTLLKIIEKTNKQEHTDIRNTIPQYKTNIPINSYMTIIQDSIEFGDFENKEIIYSQNVIGEIDWEKTITQTNPTLINKNIYYLNPIMKSKRKNTEDFFSMLYNFCLYESFQTIGWLYSIRKINKPNHKFSLQQALSYINEEMKITNNQRKKKILNAMRNIILCKNENTGISFYFGTNNFEYIWQNMIDSVCGIANKQDFFPKAHHYTIDGTVKHTLSLYPDTISLLLLNNAFVLDGKHYTQGTLPGTESIIKQIEYGEFLTTETLLNKINRTEPFNNIYNAFVLPGRVENDYECISYANIETRSNTNTYENIIETIVDVRKMFETFLNDDKAFAIKVLNTIKEKADEITLRYRQNKEEKKLKDHQT